MPAGVLRLPPLFRVRSVMTETPRQEAASSLKIYFRLLAYVKPYIGYFLVSIIGFIPFV